MKHFTGDLKISSRRGGAAWTHDAGKHALSWAGGCSLQVPSAVLHMQVMERLREAAWGVGKGQRQLLVERGHPSWVSCLHKQMQLRCPRVADYAAEALRDAA